MRLKVKDFYNLFLILFFLAVIIAALGYNPKARLIPLVIALPCLGMAIAQFILDLGRGGKKGSSMEDELFQGIMKKVYHMDISADDQVKEKKWGLEKTKRLSGSIFWILCFVASIFLLGFLTAIPLFTIIYMRFKRESWLLSLSCAAGLWLTVYLAFVVAAKTTLYEGLIFRLFGGE
ncbi:MAG: tripartite tricarboxylate transporter TctB family protein [Thermodesulfobacteriota bacterium]|nr:tripartite tricarboxylate transporter TctB family protein [Thermodesulfobacteriota bacterium]